MSSSVRLAFPIETDIPIQMLELPLCDLFAALPRRASRGGNTAQTRTAHLVRNHGLTEVWTLALHSENDLKRWPNFGPTSMAVVREVVEGAGLRLGLFPELRDFLCQDIHIRGCVVPSFQLFELIGDTWWKSWNMHECPERGGLTCVGDVLRKFLADNGLRPYMTASDFFVNPPQKSGVIDGASTLEAGQLADAQIYLLRSPVTVLELLSEAEAWARRVTRDGSILSLIGVLRVVGQCPHRSTFERELRRLGLSLDMKFGPEDVSRIIGPLC